MLLHTALAGGVIVIVSLAVAVLLPSEIIYGKVLAPINPEEGVNMIEPVVDTVTIPPVTGIVYAVPGTIAVPLILVITNTPVPIEVSPVSGRRVTGVVPIVV
jgi:hypothetical protein